ncbi:hypothetical protein QQS21_005654 [Conoideocrella luteorostrata]|uniref:Zn(2)-C6 fungal-type domain-containing protein n=1 Tax=Conoideocrella luteorostrata TaxID=1105319 RepID=A0AAJ0G0S5_9HYPO|nr:hypothetical protein QQS21_005654 [Conoideocrella luteorostrata]
MEMPSSEHVNLKEAHAHLSTVPSDSVRKRVRRKQRNPRIATSCEPCRASKLRCDRRSPCGACERRNTLQRCRYSNSKDKSAGVSQQPPSSDDQVPNTDNSHYRGDEDYMRVSWDEHWQRPSQATMLKTHRTLVPPHHMTTSPSVEELVSYLPPADYCDYLMTQYFTYIAPMFFVLHETSFQIRYTSLNQDRQFHDNLSWLALIFSILSVAVQTLEFEDTVLKPIRRQFQGSDSTRGLATELRTLAMACLSADKFMFCFNLVTLESVILLCYGICHDSGVDAAWNLLGVATNMGAALKCSSSLQEPRDSSNIDSERRRRCWISILSLHTYQAILFRDVDVQSLVKTLPPDLVVRQEAMASMPATGTVVMNIKMRLFKLASRICSTDAIKTIIQEEDTLLESLDADLSKEREFWSAQFLDNGALRVLEPTSYAHWCMFEMYAHQLYLHLHRPFSRSQPTANRSRYRQSSKWRCIASGAALLDIQEKYLELPQLRHHCWTIYGMNASCTVHGALALASCLLGENQEAFNLTQYKVAFDAAVNRMGRFQHCCATYLKAYPVLSHIQYVIR